MSRRSAPRAAILALSIGLLAARPARAQQSADLPEWMRAAQRDLPAGVFPVRDAQGTVASPAPDGTAAAAQGCGDLEAARGHARVRLGFLAREPWTIVVDPGLGKFVSGPDELGLAARAAGTPGRLSGSRSDTRPAGTECPSRPPAGR